jgi:hypothetical protein
MILSSPPDFDPLKNQLALFGVRLQTLNKPLKKI